MTTAHATPELLAAYASGALSDGMSLLVASHLTFCPACRARVARFEGLCGALLVEGDAVAPTPACLAGALARLDEVDEAADLETTRGVGSDFPAPLGSRIGACASAIRWRFLLPGLSEHRLEGFVGEDVRLLRARPGTRILKHTHAGEEATLILSGRMRDGDRVYVRGDVALADQTDEHRPQIVGSEVCVCLVVLSGPMRFTGRMSRALNLLNR